MPSDDARRELKKLKDATDRQRALNEVCKRVLAGFQGRKVTPELMAEAEAVLRAAIDRSVQEGNYIIPEGLMLDRVELGADMRLKVFFKDAWSEENAFFRRAPEPQQAPKPTAAPAGRFEAVVAEINDMLDEKESK